VPVSVIDGLATGHDLKSIVTRLQDSERSRRLQLINHLLRVSGQASDFGPLRTLAPAQELLARAQHSDPSAVEQVLAYPQTGLWVTHGVRRISDVISEEVPLWVHLGHYNALAAAAAIRAGLDFSIEVPARDGAVHLPGLGCARFEHRQRWSVAEVTGEGNALIVSFEGTRTRLHRAGRTGSISTSENGISGWEPLTQVSVGSGDELTLSVSLDILDPYLDRAGLQPLPALTPAQLRAWSELLTEAWDLLARDHPQEAEGLAQGLHSIVPLASEPGSHGRSGSSSDAFGAAALSLPSTASALAMTLVHEFRHSLLNGLLHLVPLCDQADKRPRYAPWRDDPRPMIGLLHGAFAFTGVTEFWRTRTEKGDEVERDLAGFEFALRRQQIKQVLGDLAASSSLTETGTRLVQRLSEHSEPWHDDPVPDRSARFADLSVASHRAAWRAAHLDVDSEWARDCALRRANGDPARPLPVAGDVVRADSHRTQLDRVSAVSRRRLTGVNSTASGFDAETALLDGNYEQARQLYLRMLAVEPDSAAAWGGLAVAMTGHPSRAAARILIERPECVRAVYQEEAAHPISSGTDSSGAVIEIADWLDRNG
jgi:HEXXH motif-containing protein